MSGRGLRRPSGGPWRGLVWDGEDVVVRDLESLGWALVRRWPPTCHVTVLTFSKPDADTGIEQLGRRRPSALAKRLVQRVLAEAEQPECRPHRDVAA